MSFVALDWSIQRATKNIRYIGDAHGGASPSYASVIELHRALQAFAYDAESSGDDEISIVDYNPSKRGGVDTNITLVNSYNIDDTASEHLYDGSITQSDGDVIYDGVQVFCNATSIQVVQNGAKIANDFWNESAMMTATSDALSSTTHRFLVKVRTAGADIDGRRILGIQRALGTFYTEFFIGGGTNRGNNVLALTANTDGNNQTIAATIATWTDIVNDVEGYTGIDATGDGADEFYYSNWELGTRSKNEFYERAKWIQREGSTETVYGLNGELFRGITNEITIDTPTGTFQEPEPVSWTGGTGQLLAVDSPTAGTKMWIQLLTGQAPTDGLVITGGTSAATAAVNATVTSRTLSACFVGSSTGTSINPGAFGVGIGADDLAASDLLVDLTGTNQTPPNNVTFSVAGLVTGEDYVLVGPEDGAGGLDVAQLALNATLTGAAVTSVPVVTTIPSDTPQTGTIRVQDDSGDYVKCVYTSYSGSTFTINAKNFSVVNATLGNNSFISYIDMLADAATVFFTSVFDVPRSLFIRVRDGGVTPIVPFETTGTLGNAGGSVTAIRQADV